MAGQSTLLPGILTQAQQDQVLRMAAQAQAQAQVNNNHKTFSHLNIYG